MARLRRADRVYLARYTLHRARGMEATTSLAKDRFVTNRESEASCAAGIAEDDLLRIERFVAGRTICCG
jgi:hypothetical protein